MSHGTAVAVGSLHAQYATFLQALDPALMGPMLDEAFGEDAGVGCVVADAKYEPGRPSTVLYRRGTDLFHATVPPPGQGAPGVLLPNGVGVTAFPVDPGLPTLPEVLDPARGGSALSRALGIPRRAKVETRLLRYRPGRRATLLVTVPGGGATATPYVAKVYHDGAKAAAVAAEGRGLGALALPPPLVLAPVVAHLPDLAVVVQGHVPGDQLAIDDWGPVAVERRGADVARAAQALAALHRGRVASGRPRPVDRELHRFVDRATAIRAVDRATGEHLLGLAHLLLGWRSGPGPVSLVHGDCKPSQFLMAEDRVAILDLDHCGLADPASDVGNFVSSLRQGAIRAGGQGGDGATGGRSAAEALGATFVAAYLDRAQPTAPDQFAERVAFYVAVPLLRKALRAFARSPSSPLPGLYVDEGRRVAADRRDTDRGRG